ncbi:MAG: TolC family protein [Desulfobacterales bacterium]|jgi:outer membrane protein TolC|nr:TolC family protein [Desulfobacterales bacterium]
MVRHALVLLAIVLLSAGPADAESTELRLGRLVAEALANSPRIAAARERHVALKEKIPQSGALADPMLGVGVVNLPTSFDFDEEDMTAKEISLSQSLPFPGKRGLSEEVAAREADAGAAEVAEIANQVVKEVKGAFYDLSHVHRSLEVTRRNQRLLEELAAITHSRYSLGQGIQEEVVRSRVEISKMLDELLMLEQRRRALAARLNFLLNRPPQSPVGVPEEFDFRPARFSIPELQEQAAADNPMLLALQQELAARGKSIDRARRDYFPDFNVKVAYGQRDDRVDMLTGMVEMNLPIFVASRQERRVAEAYADLRATQAKYDNARNELLYLIAEQGSMAQRLEQRVALYRTGIIPQARLQIDTALSAYMVGRADFMTLLDSRMRLYRYELDFHEAVTEYEKSLAALEAAVGTDLPREEAK